MNSITNLEVVSQLDRVLASPNFIHSSVLAKFLRHIVHETVEGRGHELKEYTIGVAALKKDADFNPQIDSIVRIHAGRLRRALRDYYQTDGMNDPIAIMVPKGSYVPVFEFNTIGGVATAGDTLHNVLGEASTGRARDRFSPGTNFRLERLEGIPSIYVAPFEVVANGHFDLQTSLPEYLSSELTKFEDLIVIAGETEIATSQRADYVLRGTLHLVNQRLRIFLSLQGHDGRQYWAKTFAMAYDELWQMEDEVVARTVAALAGINGVISRVE
ncbi:MAG TPA: hypothetical protein VK658_01855, partial [Chryseolinea sp.]|nr:hypothetical protein [Chryseolinea sp.]